MPELPDISQLWLVDPDLPEWPEFPVMQVNPPDFPPVEFGLN
jgi:hypothetical protein